MKPLTLGDLLRGLIALGVVIAAVAAFSAGQTVLGIVALAAAGVGIPVSLWLSRTRRTITGGDDTTGRP